MPSNRTVGTNLILSSLLATLSYLPFEIVAKGTLIICVLLFVLDPFHESRLVAVAGVCGVLVINRARQRFVVVPSTTDGGVGDQQQQQQQQQQHGAPPHPPLQHGMPPHSSHYPPPPGSYFQPSHHEHAPYSYGSLPAQVQPPHQPPHQYPQYSSSWNPQHQQQPQHQPQHQHQQHTISHHMMPPPTSLPPPPSAGQSQHNNTMQPPHPMIPSTIGHPSTINRPASTPTFAGAPPPPAPGTSPLRNHQHSSRSNSPNDRHVQFQKDTAPGDPRRGIEDIPLMISSKKRIQPRKSSFNSEHSPTPSSQMSSSQEPLSLSPKSQGGMSHAMSHITEATGATPLTFLSTDLSVKTSDSLNHYLRGIEDEISGDVGQEVELVAHAPMLEQSPPQVQMHHHNYRGGAAYISRSTPPRHHPSGGTGSSQRSSGSRHSRRRKRRSGNHIPSNSGRVQLDWGNAAAPAPAGAATGGGGVVCGMGGTGMIVGPHSPVDRSGVNPCYGGRNAASASCGVILPTPLRSSNTGPNRSPTTSAMAPPPGMGIPPLIPGGGLAAHSAPLMTAMSPPAPMSPVHSLDLEKMSLCGTENQDAGGSIGGASLCNVFDDHEDSVIGASALMDMTMSLGSHPSSGPSVGDPSSRGSMTMGLHPIPLGLSPHAVFGDERSTGSALMDMMSVGSGGGRSKDNSRGSSRGSRASCGSSSGRSKSSGGRSGSPASIDKGSLKMEQEHHQYAEERWEQPPAAAPLMPMYGQDFKFTWDGKREE
mmetsp:Transcript_14083/g.24748  ORF Transcript_14083/g.24748 Transcript_14083/m.24748 type:complete len:759 (+) Transcript_14083:192-2468(+)